MDDYGLVTDMNGVSYRKGEIMTNMIELINRLKEGSLPLFNKIFSVAASGWHRGA